ncbi:histidine triad nucleotide-binding protein [Demequina sp. NBRC 110052]|uniref:histidine triad nucleotide-binding protein n=1 Tax=Demequina sp. NBRC 110052 TaxID=1570341 RepID=UPI0009FCF0D9|nr:histidine triad nucleotide-binding protein [Demequina sp. NBRC 110052]
MTDCLFCRIVDGEIPADIVVESDDVIAFRDIAPKAPVHVLVVPRAHHANVAELADASPALLARMAQVAREVADAECGGEFRWIFNTGASAGQSVFHVHGHVLGGGELGWEPA